MSAMVIWMLQKFQFEEGLLIQILFKLHLPVRQEDNEWTWKQAIPSQANSSF